MFYAKLQSVLSEKGISMTTFVESIGMGRSNVTQWKSGSEPRNSTKKKIADALGVDVSVFSESAQQKTPPAEAEGNPKLAEAIELLQGYDEETLDDAIKYMKYLEGSK